MNHEDQRIERVCWKILRGLYFLEREAVLKEASPITFGVLNHISQMTEGLLAWWQGASGAFPYPQVFDYRFRSAAQSDTGEEQWMLYLWEALMWITSFPAPAPAERQLMPTDVAGPVIPSEG